MKRHATTIALFVLAVALGVWLWLERDKVSEGERKRRENNVFTAWRREDLSRIEIAHEGETIVLERDAKADKPWRMTSPRQERVDQAAAERLTTTLEFATMVRKVGEDGALGFDAPRATGSLTMGPLVFRFTLGGVSPRPEGSGYFRVDDGAPFVASKELTDTLLASADTYRDRTVVPYLSLELARFEVKHPGGGFVVDRADERSFKVQGPGVLASRNALDKVWSALAEMRAEAFPKDADAERLVQNPRLTILMTPNEAGKPAGELVVGDVCPGHPDDVVVLRKQPTRVASCAPRGAMDALLEITPAALVDRRPFSFRHDEIEELRLESLVGSDAGVAVPDAGGAPRVLELARRGSGFHQREPVDRDLTPEEAESANELLARIEQDQADDVRPGGGPFTAVARARVRAGDHDEVVEVGAAEGASVTLRRVRDDARLVVSRAIARRLVPRATSTRPRVLLGEARRVKRVVLRCGTPQELADEGTGLKLVEPTGYETDGSIVQLVDGLERGKVIAWVADANDGSFGLGPEGCRVILSFEDGNAPATVRFGAEGEGGLYGTVDGRPEVFVAPLALHELAKRIYVSHASLRVEPARIESVKVAVRGKPVREQDPSTLAAAAGALFADRVSALGSSDVGPVDVELQMALAEGGPPKRVVCGAPEITSSGKWRRCATPGVKAVFEVRANLLDAFTQPAVTDASAPDAR
ncbi:MAG: hypothetical protein K0S65_6220 [Labilithrix sp.]|nr:hypothetical protein [Labilithrix sp.]